MTDHLLSIVTFLPLVGAVLLLLWRGSSDDGARSTAMFTTVVTFIVSLAILGRFDRADPGFQMVERATWVKSVGLQYLVGIDGVSLWMVLLTTFLMPLAVLASWPVISRMSGRGRHSSSRIRTRVVSKAAGPSWLRGPR